jgi:hypothetical protein
MRIESGGILLAEVQAIGPELEIVGENLHWQGTLQQLTAQAAGFESYSDTTIEPCGGTLEEIVECDIEVTLTDGNGNIMIEGPLSDIVALWLQRGRSGTVARAG